jgi:hypothetical protein
MSDHAEHHSNKTHLPPIPAGLTTPFYYAALANCVVHYLVDPHRVKGLFEGSGLEPALFDVRGHKKASVSYNFQVYSGFFSAGVDLPPDQWSSSASSVVQELELNIVAFPEGRRDDVPVVTFDQWLMGDEQTKLLGNHRVFVPCDDTFAIKVGTELFGEPKFLTTFKVNMPSQNPVRASSPRDSKVYHSEWVQTWGFQVEDPDVAGVSIFTTIVDTTGLTPLPAAISPITEYGVPADGPIGCRWNILQPFDTYFIADDGPAERVRLIFGESTHEMAVVMKELLHGVDAYAVQMYLSDPVAVQSRPYFLKPPRA